MAEWTTTSAASNDTVWSAWTSVDAGTTGSSNNDVWASWANSTLDSATTSSSNTVWVLWTATGNTPPIQTYERPRETEEERQARLEREAQRKLELEILRKEREAAQVKAAELLRATLDQVQKEQFDKTKWFYVIGQSGTRYRIRHGWAGNIDELDEKDMIVAGHCIHPQVRVPTEDNMLIQKLMLEADEERFLEIANRNVYLEPRPIPVA